MENQRQAYREEARELLAELENALLELEETPDDSELIGRVFRAMHTIKGSGAMFGFDDIAAFTHEIETIFDRVRGGEIAVSKEMVNLSLSARDQIQAMLDASEGENTADASNGEAIISAFRSLIVDAGLPEPDQPGGIPEGVTGPLNAPPETGKAAHATYRIRFRPEADIFASGTNPILLLNELRELGDSTVVAQTDAIPELADLAPEACHVYWDIILTSSQGIDAIKDVFIFVEDDCELRIDVVDDGRGPGSDADYKRLGEILVERGDLSTGDLVAVLREQKPIGELLVEKEILDGGVVTAALAEQHHVRQVRDRRREKAAGSSIRVAADKLDALVNLVGELVTVQARLSQKAAQDNECDLLAIAEEVERLTAELRDNTMSIRMLPIGTTFSTFKRLVRDLSRDLDKNVILTTAGEETELDKTVIEQLNDPLVHIIRNSIDHGIEVPAAREASGKPVQGTVHLSAVHSGGDVLIQISDDGAGLDPQAIRKKAVARELITPDADLTENEIFQLIFAPGFSTAEAVTSVSGRGVGMDVVKRSIEALRGSIDISSRKGAGTTITLRLPLTLAIIDGLLVKIADDAYVFPLASVEECTEFSRHAADKARERKMMNFRGNIISYLSLREIFAVEGEPPDNQQVVVAEINGEKIGFAVDHVIGQHQTVIKTLSRVYKDVQGISGATILGDGTVALILDIQRLAYAVETEEQIAA